jgi:hypothetical protein
VDQRIQHLLNQISALESELQTELHKGKQSFFIELRANALNSMKLLARFTASRKRASFVRFSTAARRIFSRHRSSMVLIVPLLFLDVCISIYQTICFPIYGVAKIKRADYIVMDRWQLGYLNLMEKFHCVHCAYCEYANGLFAYGTEIAARTEQYWCPIKHAHKVLGTHARYEHFLAYGDAERYQVRLKQFREALRQQE